MKTRPIIIGALSEMAALQALAAHHVLLNPYAEQLLRWVDFTPPEHQYILHSIELTVGELGLAAGGVWAEVLAAAVHQGCYVCPMETAIWLRLSCLDQPEGPWVTVATLKPTERLDDPNGFYLQRRRDGLWLRGYRASVDHHWAASESIIFRQAEA